MSAPLFDEAFLKKLELLYIISKRVFAGKMKGERRSKKLGSGIEFADHRDYSLGDDLKYIDWNIYGRLDKLLLRLFEEEEDLYIYLLLDISKSMALGTHRKLDYAKKTAAALAYIGLSNLDRVSITTFNDKVVQRLAPARGKANIFKVMNLLSAIKGDGPTQIFNSFKTFVHQNKRRGIAVVISDFYDVAGYMEGINYLRFNKFRPILLHLTDAAELQFEVKGDIRLIDAETQAVKDIVITEKLLKRFQSAYHQYGAKLAAFCQEKQLNYFKAQIQVPFDELILSLFRQGGFLK